MRSYLKAVEAAGTDDADAVLAKMKSAPINDAFADNNYVRGGGQMVQDMYVVEFKSPEQSKGKGDYTRSLQTIPGDQSFQSVAQSESPAFKKKDQSCGVS